MPNIGPLELAIILLIVLIIFGPSASRGSGRQLGSGMREFKDSITGKDKDDDEERTRSHGRAAPGAPSSTRRGRARGRHRRGAPRGPARLARRRPEQRRGARDGRLRPVGHEDRLSLIEHLDELRTRLIFCIAAFIVCFTICYWQNHWLLETINKPLQSTQNLDGKKRSKDPLEQSARFRSAAAPRRSDGRRRVALGEPARWPPWPSSAT